MKKYFLFILITALFTCSSQGFECNEDSVFGLKEYNETDLIFFGKIIKQEFLGNSSRLVSTFKVLELYKGREQYKTITTILPDTLNNMECVVNTEREDFYFILLNHKDAAGNYQLNSCTRREYYSSIEQYKKPSWIKSFDDFTDGFFEQGYSNIDYLNTDEIYLDFEPGWKGQMVKGYPEGEWEYFKGKSVEKGSYSNGKRNGVWTENSNTTRQESLWVEGRLEGITTEYIKPSFCLEDGYSYKLVTNYLNGVKDGEEILYSYDGRLLSRKEYVNDKITKISFYTVEGELVKNKEISTKIDCECGEGCFSEKVFYNEQLIKVRKWYEEGVLNEHWELNKHGELVPIFIKDQDSDSVFVRQGTGHYLGLYTGELIDSLKVGIWKGFTETGTYEYLNYRRGVKEGDYLETIQRDVIITKGSYTNGVKNGEWKQFFSNGKLRKIVVYENGTPFLKTSYDLEGFPMVENGNGTHVDYGIYDNNSNRLGENRESRTYKNGVVVYKENR
ncbi:MAG: hypothetical protein AB8B53_01180 [Flavobacteriales bacterium]